METEIKRDGEKEEEREKLDEKDDHEIYAHFSPERKIYIPVMINNSTITMMTKLTTIIMTMMIMIVTIKIMMSNDGSNDNDNNDDAEKGNSCTYFSTTEGL